MLRRLINCRIIIIIIIIIPESAELYGSPIPDESMQVHIYAMITTNTLTYNKCILQKSAKCKGILKPSLI